ncbi:MAG: hypothetical protein ABI723_18560 [Bacteroidia bacterium]
MARKISSDEARKLGLKPMGKKHPVRALIETMHPGELLHITREDFKWKAHTPLLFTNQIMKTSDKKFVVMKTVNKNGWVVERVG